MSQFSRRARWLNALFPASVAPQVRDPGQVSDDVSLVAAYDGSGWAIPRLADTIFSADSPIAATGNVTIVTVGPEQVFRLFSVHAFTIVPATADFAPQIFDPITGLVCQLAPLEQTLGLAQGSVVSRLDRAIVLGPGARLRIEHVNGTGTTALRYRAFGFLVPAGTVFQC